MQDYVSIAWPVIDATYRYSFFTVRGTMVAHAPMYCAHLGGLQNQDVTPYSVTSPSVLSGFGPAL